MRESPFAKKPTPPAPTPQPSIEPEPADEIAMTRAVAEIQAAAGVKIWANFLFGFYGAVFGLPLLGLLLLWMIFTFSPRLAGHHPGRPRGRPCLSVRQPVHGVAPRVVEALTMAPGRCGSCAAPWPRVTEIRVERAAGE